MDEHKNLRLFSGRPLNNHIKKKSNTTIQINPGGNEIEYLNHSKLKLIEKNTAVF
jgi:hypothetical protein